MIFAVSNQKGGVGKTTSVLNIASYLAKKGNRVLIVDTDPQANLTSGLAIKLSEDDKGIYDVLIDGVPIKDVIKSSRIQNLDIAPSTIELAGAEVEMVNALSRENILKKALSSVEDEYNFVIIDCPPSLGLLTVNGLVAADNILIPVQAEYFALEGLGQLMNTIELVRNNLNASLSIGGVIVTMFDSRTNLSKDVASEIENFFGEKIFKTVIPRNIRLSEAPSHGLSILEFDPHSTGAQAYESLVKEILTRFPVAKHELTRPKI